MTSHEQSENAQHNRVTNDETPDENRYVLYDAASAYTRGSQKVLLLNFEKFI